jgi:hypothetical protein
VREEDENWMLSIEVRLDWSVGDCTGAIVVRGAWTSRGSRLQGERIGLHRLYYFSG